MQAATLATTDHLRARQFFESAFQPFAVQSQQGGLFTGYYEIGLRAALEPSDDYRFPIYARPPSLVQASLDAFNPELSGQSIAGRVTDDQRLIPFYTRAEIDNGAIADDTPVLAWANNPVDVYFLHIQGSGRITVPDGRSYGIGFDAKNGHPYRSVGKVLIDRGIIPREAMSAPAIKQWMERNPASAMELMHQNPSYIFFRWLDSHAPLGAQGAPLTPGRSLAVDTRFIPLGAPLWIDTTTPPTPNYPPQPLQRLVIAQDTGSAIKGPVRGDFFWGYGTYAEEMAGYMQSPGRYVVLLPHSLAGTVSPAR